MINLSFDFSINLLENITWQYDKALKAVSLAEWLQEFVALNYTAFWQDWKNNVFNLIKADEFGLEVWSIILDQPLLIGGEPDPSDKPIWGYDEYYENYDNGNYANATSGPVLTLEEKRLILRLRFFQLFARANCFETNYFLKILFGEDNVYVLDGQDMSMRVVYLNGISEALQTFIKQFDLIPRPAAVKISYLEYNDRIFGYDQYYQNYDNGNYINEIT